VLCVSIIQQMEQGQHRVSPEHARAGPAHDPADLVAPGRGVAVDRAVETGRLAFPVGAAVEAPGGVLGECVAVGTQSPATMVGPAEEADHRLHGAALAGQAGRDRSHLLTLGSHRWLDLDRGQRRGATAG
jgi:hypothetical protein